MTNSTSVQGKKNGLLAKAWDAEDNHEVATWEYEELTHVAACDCEGSPAEVYPDLGSLLELGLHVEPGFSRGPLSGGWRADDHMAPFDENELPSLYYEAGAYHSLDCLPGDNSRFMFPGDPTNLSKSYKDMIAEAKI